MTTPAGALATIVEVYPREAEALVERHHDRELVRFKLRWLIVQVSAA